MFSPLQRAGFDAFWRDYLRSHQHPMTRGLHYLATSIGIGIGAVTATAWSGTIWILPAGLAVSYALALGSHRWIERRPSLMSVNPIYGAIADVRMCWLALTGQLSSELARVGLRSTPSRIGAPMPERS